MKTNITKFVASDLTKSEGYRIEAVKMKDHALVRIIGKAQTAEVIIALPDSTRYLYIGLTGKNCCIRNISTEKSETQSPEDYIPRIAEEISYITDAPTGDIPNVQVDGYRTASSEGMPIKDGLTITFHTKCLPTARLVWHCPFIDIFCSDDGTVNGET
ncbi:MAG: diguanylate cyclase, partial [Ruminiclostridium sp.]|nr:diguanylate cyclase [Ruminiclostridium sp.]